MTLNAVQWTIYEAINGIQPSVYYPSPVEAHIRPLVPDVLSATAPQVFIWGAQGEEMRYTPPRKTTPLVGPGGAGYRKVTHKVRIWITATSENISQSEIAGAAPERGFPVLIWQVMDVLRSLDMPVTITDPDTDEQSEMILVGEEFTWDYDLDRSLTEQGWLRSVALLEAPVVEMWQE